MPPKDSEDLLNNVYFGVSTGDGGYEYKPVGYIEHIDLTDNKSMLPRLGEDMYGHFTSVKPGTTKLGWIAITEMIWNGNSLYLKFPKKGRRKLRRYNRCRRVSLIRLKKWSLCIPTVMHTKVFENRSLYDEWRKKEKGETDEKDIFKSAYERKN